mgnify:FL=1
MGKEMQVSSPELLRSLVLQGDESYWCGGSGEGSFEAEIESETAMLSLLLKEPYGFLLQYGTYESTDDFVAISSTDYSTTIEASIGGNPWVVPTAFFVSREQAYHAVEEFCRTGQMSKSLRWGKLSEQNWEFDG